MRYTPGFFCTAIFNILQSYSVIEEVGQFAKESLLQITNRDIKAFFSKEINTAKPISVTESGIVIVMLSKAVQRAKAVLPKVFQKFQSGMVMLFKELQPSKAWLPISVTESGIVMLFKELQPQKAQRPISVTESGMVMLSKDLQLSKAPSPIFVTESGMVMLSKDFQWSKPRNSGNPPCTISVTESAMVILLKK